MEYPLNVVKLYWSRSGIMHVAMAWDNKPLEYLNICQYSRKEGPLKYIQELEQFRADTSSLPVLMAADALITKKLYRLQSEQERSVHHFLRGADRGHQQPQILHIL